MASGKMRSVDAGRFAMVPRVDIPRSAFDIQTAHKTTFDSGWLIPIFVHEILPGDSVRLDMTAFCRLATPVVPVMDNLHLESFFFFCPNRLVWDNWQRFMGEQNAPTDTTQFLVPQLTVDSTATAVGDMADYFGITINEPPFTLGVNALPFRMYNLIFNEWFRDEDLVTPATVPLTDGPDVMATYPLRKRGKRHDYFTTCRPWPQKPGAVGDTGSFNGLGPFVPGGAYIGPHAGAPVSGIGVGAGTPLPPLSTTLMATTGGRNVVYDRLFDTTPGFLGVKSHDNAAFPDVRVLINDIRTANQIQLLLERNARGGTRYTEILRSHFGVQSPDARLQRPEYLGGGRTMVTVNPVAQTSASVEDGTVLGELAGVGSAVVNRHGFSSSFTEHGFVIGLVNVRADLTYQQGVNRMWMRRGRYDYYWPALAHLGEQAVFTREIYAGAADDGLVFGYQERWAEYRSIPSRISGGFRSTVPAPLDMWHFAQEFGSRPVLNATFISEDPPIERVLQVNTLEGFQFLFDSVFDVRMVRAIPMFSIPGMGPRL